MVYMALLKGFNTRQVAFSYSLVSSYIDTVNPDSSRAFVSRRSYT